ncbi:MAG: hypothetical protein ABSG43_17710 [Solirubrobacteraceae bacterium]|jgi:DnaJ-class molecular chaperone
MNDQRNEWDAARVLCRPCHGTGLVLSTLGGTEHQLTCPWCAGGSEFIPGRDAQQSPAEQPGA